MHENRETSIVPANSAGRTAKAQSHKAGTHAMEESDCGEVPMNQSNKGVQAPAEVGEGRLRPEENTGQSHTPPALNGQRVSQGSDSRSPSSRIGPMIRANAPPGHWFTRGSASKCFLGQYGPRSLGNSWQERQDGNANVQVTAISRPVIVRIPLSPP